MSELDLGLEKTKATGQQAGAAGETAPLAELLRPKTLDEVVGHFFVLRSFSPMFTQS